MVPECEKSSATTYYWYREALDISDNISESGGLNWKMTLCLLAAWSMVCLAMIKGIQSSGKVCLSSPFFEGTGGKVSVHIARLNVVLDFGNGVHKTKGQFLPKCLGNPLTPC